MEGLWNFKTGNCNKDSEEYLIRSMFSADLLYRPNVEIKMNNVFHDERGSINNLE